MVTIILEGGYCEHKESTEEEATSGNPQMFTITVQITPVIELLTIIIPVTIVVVAIFYFAYRGFKETDAINDLARRYEQSPWARMIAAVPIIGTGVHETLDALSADFDQPEQVSSINRLWSFERNEQVSIVCPELDDFPDNQKNFLYFRKYGDLDAFIWILSSLASIYPGLQVNFFTSEEYLGAESRQADTENIIVVGGPDFNNLSRLMMDEVPFEYYKKDGDVYLKNNSTSEMMSAEFVRGEEGIEEIVDYGFFAKFPNPNEESNDIILVSGLHTHAVFGAAQAFIARKFDNATRVEENCQKIIESEGDDPQFAVQIEVECINRRVQVPEINKDDIVSLK